jgi:hypothetical protein
MNKKRVEDKWGPTLTSAGWSAIPNMLVDHQRELKLDSTDLNILLILVRYWWLADS